MAGFDMSRPAHVGVPGRAREVFISPLTNLRGDEYGGPIANRLRYPLEVFRAVRAVWPRDKPMSIRISAADWAPGGLSEQDLLTLARAFKEAGVDLIDVSTGQVVPQQEPVYGRMYQTPFADKIRNEVGIATMAVGNITGADQVNTIVVSGRADLVALARPHLADPYFTLHAAAWYQHAAQVWPETLPAWARASIPSRRARSRGMDRGTRGAEAAQPRGEGRAFEGAAPGGCGERRRARQEGRLSCRAPGRYPLYPINRRAAPAQKCAPPSRYPQESSRGARPPRIHTLSPEPAPRGSGSR